MCLTNTEVGGKKSGKRGRGGEGSTTVFFAVEKSEYTKNGRKKYKAGFCKATIIKKDSLLETDGWRAYENLGLTYISHQQLRTRPALLQSSSPIVEIL